MLACKLPNPDTGEEGEVNQTLADHARRPGPPFLDHDHESYERDHHVRVVDPSYGL